MEASLQTEGGPAPLGNKRENPGVIAFIYSKN